MSALDGITGTEMALNETIDLIVLDLMLPAEVGRRSSGPCTLPSPACR